MVRLLDLKRLVKLSVVVLAVVIGASACYPPAGPVGQAPAAGATEGAGSAAAVAVESTARPQDLAGAAAESTAQPAGSGGAATVEAPQPGSGVTPAAESTAEPVDRWTELLTHTPYSYTLPLPPHAATPIDGTYTKIDPRTAPHVHCLRCPDYMMEGGLWKLQLDRGVFRIYYAGTGWRSLGSYTLDGDRLQLFNDPNCTDAIGTYTWKLEGGALVLAAVEDSCGQGLRAANLSDRPWLSCQPPNREAAVTDHWHKPEGCDPTS